MFLNPQHDKTSTLSSVKSKAVIFTLLLLTSLITFKHGGPNGHMLACCSKLTGFHWLVLWCTEELDTCNCDALYWWCLIKRITPDWGLILFRPQLSRESNPVLPLDQSIGLTDLMTPPPSSTDSVITNRQYPLCVTFKAPSW